MTRKEFEQKVKDENLKMRAFDIELDHYYDGYPHYMGCVKNEGKWVIYETDKRSLPELIKVLEQGDCINLLAEPTIKTDWDKINIYILGDERSSEGFILELFNDREFISGDENDCFGPVTIPLGQKPEETGWEYIRPLIEDLKKL